MDVCPNGVEVSAVPFARNDSVPTLACVAHLLYEFRVGLFKRVDPVLQTVDCGAACGDTNIHPHFSAQQVIKLQVGRFLSDRRHSLTSRFEIPSGSCLSKSAAQSDQPECSKLEDVKETKRVSASSSRRPVRYEADVPVSDAAPCYAAQSAGTIKRVSLELPVQFLNIVLLVQDGGDLAVPVATETGQK